MPSDELRRRLEALNRKPLENVPADSPAKPDAGANWRRSARQRARPGEQIDASVQGGPLPTLFLEGEEEKKRGPYRLSAKLPALPFEQLEACLPGAIRTAPGGQLYYHIQRRLADHAPWTQMLGAEVGKALDTDTLRAHLRRTTGVPPEQTLFLDLETLGLNGEPLFLVGTLRIGQEGTVACHQLLARDYAEEAGAVAAVAEMLREARLLVTFNGKTFDMPMLRIRADVHGIALPDTPAHLDVLVEARRRYRRRVPNCRLQTLEQRICGRTRTGDIPGAEIPGVYRDFVRTGNAAYLAVVAQHNLLDLATTADLLTRLWG